MSEKTAETSRNDAQDDDDFAKAADENVNNSDEKSDETIRENYENSEKSDENSRESRETVCEKCECTCDCPCCQKICARYKKVHPLFAAVVFIVVIAAGFGILAGFAKIQNNEIDNLKSQISSLQSTNEQNSVRENGVIYSGVDGQTALSLLQKSHAVTTKSYGDLGEMVTSIDGVTADSAHFWAFYVNGAMASAGAASYKTSAGQTISWKLEEINQ